MHKCSSFPTSSPAFVIIWLFYNNHSNRHEVISHHVLDLHYSNDKWYWGCFLALADYFYLILNKCLFRSLPVFLTELFGFFSYWVVWVPCLLGYWSLVWLCGWQRFFFLFHRLSFHFAYCFFWCGDLGSLMPPSVDGFHGFLKTFAWFCRLLKVAMVLMFFVFTVLPHLSQPQKPSYIAYLHIFDYRRKN